jgi:nucleoside-diphosphate-sugar epimerase
MAKTSWDIVTGAFGFSGSYVVKTLLAQGRSVIATDLEASTRDEERHRVLENTGVDLNHPALRVVAADLLEPASLGALFDAPVSRVFHPASLYDYSATLERLRRINVEGTRHLLAEVRKHDIDRFVHWSTCGVFGKPVTIAEGKRRNVPFSERSSSPKNAAPGASGPDGTPLVNAYSISKWDQEQLVWREHREQDLPLTVIRPAPIYGPGSQYGHCGIVQSIARGLLPAIPADSKNFVTTSVHVQDVARFACFIAEREDAVGEDYNVVDQSIISYHEFLHYIALLTGRPMFDLPFVKNRWLRPVMVGAAKAWTQLEKRFGLPRLRVLEVQSAEYVASSYWLSNRKSLSTGFVYDYPDVREGLKDTVAWMTRCGWV